MDNQTRGRRGLLNPLVKLTLMMLVSVSFGCAQGAMLRDHAVFSGQSAMNALSPVFDPAGGSVSPQGREIERNLSR